ncbi:MAG TPA: transaldolase [Candidatus Dormibacteraeota bacterium]
MSPTNPLEKLTRHGQSVWLDYISRELVSSGELERLIVDRYVTGLTSNPTIFEKAIGHGTDYDAHLAELLAAGTTDPERLYVELAAADIQRAADILRPVHDRTGGADGYVSFEVAPALADDTARSVRAARQLWQRVDRPNLMIKVPATPAGIPAIEELIALGLNINVTLIFALSAYEAVAMAYIKGLEQRVGRGERPTNHSVASFFVSRVDTAVDKLLEEKLAANPDDAELSSLRGQAAIANAVLAYEKFAEIFSGARFRALREAGAHPQRPLWASTSAKNPAYRDVVYAEALIGPDTVDTMPPATLDAFADHGQVPTRDTVSSDYAGAHRVMERLGVAGIDMDEVTEDLLRAGVRSFADSYDSLIRTIAAKAERMRVALTTGG